MDYETNDKIIANKYKLGNILSNGSFGVVFSGKNINTDEKVAIKFENPNTNKSLKHETKILNYLYSNKVRKIPAIYWYGNYSCLTCLVITFYEKSLLEYMNNEEKTNEKTINERNLQKIGESMIDILSNIHENFIIHRDLKPQNFMIKNNELYLIDFGLSTFYISDTNEHLPNIRSDTIIGTPKYMSINILEGNRYSRRDDMISIGYILVNIYLGRIFWEKEEREKEEREKEDQEQIENPNKYNKLNIDHPINRQRLENRRIELFRKYIKDTNILEYLEEVYSYNYTDKPDYIKLINIIKS
jgi:serine/threonine protein kinase